MAKPNWTLAGHLNMGTEHNLCYRDNKLGVQRETVTKCHDGRPGSSKTYYFIDGDKREFASEADMLAALEVAPRKLEGEDG